MHWFEREIAEQWACRRKGIRGSSRSAFITRHPGHDAWGRAANDEPLRRRDRLLPGRRRGGPRGRGRPGPRRRHRAGTFPLPVPRRARVSPGDLARLPASRRRAGAASAARTSGRSTTWRRSPATPRSAMRPPTARPSKRWPAASRRPGAGAARHRAGTGTAGQSHRRPRRAGRRRRLSADRCPICGRMRGDFLNMTALLCGSRFGRGLVRPGGVRFDLDAGARSSSCQRAWTRHCATSHGAVEPALELARRSGPLRGHRHA